MPVSFILNPLMVSSLRPVWLLIFISGFLHPPDFAWGSKPSSNEYLGALLFQSHAKKLHETRYWHLLLKYEKSATGGYVSEADGMAFFNSPEGKTNPRAELEATLRNFFMDSGDLPKGQEHPQCNFPARYKWLKRELSFDSRRLRDQHCDRLSRWVEALDPTRVTLVFASYFMNNPASMFGHTLLRIDSKRTGPDRKLLNYGANFAAQPDTENALLYAFKGLTGLFEGRFDLFPYFTKVQEYNNWESRDLWEYELNFAEDQLDYLLLHLWELGGTFFDYYYFQENCSYHLLSLLEIADPDLHLRDKFFFSVIPSDTVKLLMEQKGLVDKVVYRPGLLSRMNQKRVLMTPRERTAFLQVVRKPKSIEEDEFKGMQVSSQALVLDAYLDYLEYKGMQVTEDEASGIRIPRPVLLARSRLNVQREDLKEVRFSTPPDLAHGSNRLRFGVGHNDDEPFQEIAYRPAYHDILGKDSGFNRDSEIIMFDFNFRYYNETKRLKVDRATLLKITSLSAYDPLFPKPSWRLDVGVDTLRDLDCNHCNSFRGNFGAGLAYRPEIFSRFLWFGFLDFNSDFSGRLQDNYRLGASAEVGGLIELTENWKLQLLGRYTNFIFGDDTDFFSFQAGQRYSVSQNLDIRMEYRRDDRNNEGVASLNYYF